MILPSPHPLNAPVWAALTGAQAAFAQVAGPVARYRPQYSPFCGIDPSAGVTPSSLMELAALAGGGRRLMLSVHPDDPLELPPGWQLALHLPGRQLVAPDQVVGAVDEQARRLGPADAAEMAALVAITNPGPWAAQTHELGAFFGIRRAGELVAMAGERIRLDGFTEISAVCTRPDQRGQGLAARLIGTVINGIRRRDAVPFLHVAVVNEGAFRLYRSLGFVQRRDVVFCALRTPSEG